MDEADALCNKIAIMVKGKLKLVDFSDISKQLFKSWTSLIRLTHRNICQLNKRSTVKNVNILYSSKLSSLTNKRLALSFEYLVNN